MTEKETVVTEDGLRKLEALLTFVKGLGFARGENREEARRRKFALAVECVT